MRARRILALGLSAASALALLAVPGRAEATPEAPAELAGAVATDLSALAPNTTAAGEGVVVEAKFVSSLGWVKPGEGYPFRVLLYNETASPVTGISVTVTAPAGATFLAASDPTATVTGATITWAPADLPAASSDAPATVALVVEARSLGLGEDPEVVWKDLSASATLTYDGGPSDGVTSTTHGPKVIPPDPAYDTARYGDRPFPVVPVQYYDRAPETPGSAQLLAQKLNDPATPGSTFNLYQELSYGQLFPQASVPSAGIASAGFEDTDFEFSTIERRTSSSWQSCWLFAGCLTVEVGRVVAGLVARFEGCVESLTDVCMIAFLC